MITGDYFLQWWRMHFASRWIPPGSRILDIGCHQGEFLKYLGQRIAPSVGIDPLFRENGEITIHEFFPWKFREDMPFEEESFDVITLLATIEHVRQKDIVAREAYRLLVPGGRMVITVPSLMVDRILSILLILHLVEGMSLEEHHGFSPEALPDIFIHEGFKLTKAKKFQLGLNNLFVFERP